MKRKFFFVSLLIILLIAAAACSVDMTFSDAHVTKISVSGLTVTDYIAGDTLNLEGVKLAVMYSDGKIQNVDLSSEMLSGYDMSVPEQNKSVTVTYGGVSTTFTVNVFDLNFNSVVLASPPNKTLYVEGEKIYTDGASIDVIYDGGKTVNVKVTDKMLADYDNTRVGEQDIYISYHGYMLSFKVTFQAKTVGDITVLREPYQNSVFVGMGDKLDISGMKLKLIYDNGLTPEVNALDIADLLRIYIADSSVNTVVARVAYLAEDYPAEFTYEFAGNPLEGITVGTYVAPNTEIASNGVLDNVKSKTYGVVSSISGNIMTVSTVVEYNITDTSLQEGQILLTDELIGTFGGANIYARGGGGIVTSVGGGKVVMQTLPVGSFSINVKARSYASMEIIDMPVTNTFVTDIDNIIQGDTLNLSTGRVRVYYDDGTSEIYSMDNALIKVVNSDDDLLRKEIEGLEFKSVDNVTKLPAERYQLKYEVVHDYGSDVKIVVSVVDENGKNMYVQDNRYVSLEEATNYTVSITASMEKDGKTLYSECVYYLATEGAGVRHNQLDITAAGRHNLLVIYGGVEANSIGFIVTVIQRYPEKLMIVEGTDNISGRTFNKGDRISLGTLQYYIVYNNGEQSEPTGITEDMLSSDSSLICDTVTDRKEIRFVIPGTDVYSATLTCKVQALPIKSIGFDRTPLNVFLTSAGQEFELDGGVLRIYYQNGKVMTIGDVVGGTTLGELYGKTSGERIEIICDEKDVTPQDPDAIIAGTVSPYRAQIVYYDEDGAYGSCYMDYYIISKQVSSVKAMAEQEYYKSVYVQCEDWDLTGITLIITYVGGGSSVVNATKGMVYGSTTDYIGTDIPLKLSYMGAVDDSTLTFDVIARMETSIEVNVKGKDVYYTTDKELDLSSYRFNVFYNAGAPAEVLGITEFTGGEDAVGWWYEVYDLQGNIVPFRRVGDKIIRLYHTTFIDSEFGRVYNTVYCEFEISVEEKEIPVTGIIYEPDGDPATNNVYQGLPVLSETAAGWDLFLSRYDKNEGVMTEKYITVLYEDGTEGYAPITSDMLNYSKNDETKGYRKVTITYKGKTAEVYVRVLDAKLSSIVIEKKPVTNFIVGSDLSLDGGILKIVFEVSRDDGTIDYLEKYMSMENEQITVTGFNSNIPDNVDSVEQELTVTFKDKTTTYNVIVYNKQVVTFLYQNTIFFYGNTKEAVATPVKLIPEFDLPSSENIVMHYACSEDFIAEADLESFIAAHEGLSESDFIKVNLLDETVYVLSSKLRDKHYYEPAPNESDYYLIMEVEGNEYYKSGYYCTQKYTIIPKVIEVRAIDSTENAFVVRYSASDNPTAIYYLYSNLTSVISGLVGGVVSNVELLSPNADYFEIAVYVTSEFDENNASHVDAVSAVFTAVQNDLITGQNLKLTIGEKRKGINIGAYNGLYPELVSYRIVSGETLTLGGVLELLSGQPCLASYDYGTGTYNLEKGTLYHKNYNIDFISGKFKVLSQEITGYGLDGGIWDEGANTLNVKLGSEWNIYVLKGGSSRTLDKQELSFYTDAGYVNKLEEEPIGTGTYYVKVAGDGAFTMGGTEKRLDFILIITE